MQLQLQQQPVWPRCQPNSVPSLPRPVSIARVPPIHQHANRATRRVPVSTTAPRLPLLPLRTTSMHQPSLEVTLEDIDSGVHSAALLQRANVSPYLSSLSSRPADMPSLNLDDCGRLSRCSSWQDLSLLQDASVGPQSTSDSTSRTWEEFLGEPIAMRNDLETAALEHALKTPTAATMSAFPGFFDGGHAGSDNPTSLSPTHMDKKVLVTESDLRLSSSSKKRCIESVLRHSDGYDWYEAASDEWDSSATMRPRVKRERLFPHEAATGHHRLRTPSTPRRHHSLDPSTMLMTQRSLGLSQSEALTLRRLPELKDVSSMEYAAAVAEHHWKRTIAQERAHQAETMMAAMRERRSHPPTPPAFYNAAGTDRSRVALHRRGSRPPVKRKIGIYTPEARRERIRRFHEKRKQRVFHKRVKYDCRKRLANACPRIKGRFVKKQDDLVLSSSDDSHTSEGVHSSTDEEGESQIVAMLMA